MDKPLNEVLDKFETAELISSSSTEAKSERSMEPRLRLLEEKFESFSQKTDAAFDAFTLRLDHLEADPDEGQQQKEKWDVKRGVSMVSSQMKGWRRCSLDKPRDMSIEAMIEGGERFVQMSHAHIQAYGDGRLDYPARGEEIDSPDFLVLDALPDVLLQAFLGRFAPVASLIRDGGTPHLSLARFEDWRSFAGELLEHPTIICLS